MPSFVAIGSVGGCAAVRAYAAAAVALLAGICRRNRSSKIIVGDDEESIYILHFRNLCQAPNNGRKKNVFFG